MVVTRSKVYSIILSHLLVFQPGTFFRNSPISRPLGGPSKHLRRVFLLYHPFCDSRPLIEVFPWQPKRRIVQAPRALIVTPAVGEKRPHERGRRGPHARRHGILRPLHRLDALLVAILAGLLSNRPVRVRVARDALPALEHVPLADQEAGDDERPVAPRGYGRGLVARVLGQLLQAHEGGDGAGALLPRGEVDFGGAVVVQGELFVGKVEAEPEGAHGETVLVPQAADHGGPGAAGGLDFGEDGVGVGAQRVVVDEGFVGVVQAEDVGHDVRDPGFGGRLDNFGMYVWRGGGGEGDDEELLALEGGDDGRFIVVIDGDRLDAGRDLFCAALARQDGDGVLAGLDESFGDVLSHLAARLCVK